MRDRNRPEVGGLGPGMKDGIREQPSSSASAETEQGDRRDPITVVIAGPPVARSSTDVTTTDPVLAEHVAAIRQLGKRVVADVVEIGRRLSECKRICGHGNWLPWLDREFGWTEKTAERFMSVHALADKSDNLSNLDLPISGLYLLAAPSTPKEARDAIIERAQGGEPVSVAEVRQTIDAAKGRQQPARKQPAKKAAPSAEQVARDKAECIGLYKTAVAEDPAWWADADTKEPATTTAPTAPTAAAPTTATGNGAATAALTRRERQEIMRGEFNRVGRRLVEVNPDVAREVRTLICTYYDHAFDLVGAIERAMGIDEDSYEDDADAAQASADQPVSVPTAGARAPATAAAAAIATDLGEACR